MPIYEYQCEQGHVTEAYAAVSARHEPQECECCGRGARKVILHAPKVFGDLQGYESPASGKWIEGRRAREDDFRRTGTRPYESGEREEAQRRAAANERALDHRIDVAVEQAVDELTL